MWRIDFLVPAYKHRESCARWDTADKMWWISKGCVDVCVFVCVCIGVSALECDLLCADKHSFRPHEWQWLS